MDTDNIGQTKPNDSNESTNAASTTEESTEQKNVMDILGNGQLVKTVRFILFLYTILDTTKSSSSS